MGGANKKVHTVTARLGGCTIKYSDTKHKTISKMRAYIYDNLPVRIYRYVGI